MDTDQYKHSRLAKQIIAVTFVHHALGNRFLEKVYKNALALQLRPNGLKVQQQEPVTVSFQGEAVSGFLLTCWSNKSDRTPS
jgi:GxxExxY protein